VNTQAALDCSIIIVNWNVRDLLRRCLASLPDAAGPHVRYEVLVVDNASGDGSAERLARVFAEPRWAGRVIVLPSPHNGGFGYGMNLGGRHVLASGRRPRFVYMLNPDTEIEAGALVGLRDFMNAHPDAGLVGNLVRNASGGQTTGFRFPSLLGELEGEAGLGLVTRLLRKHMVALSATASCEVDWVSGVSMLFRSEVLTSVGLFDEAFFLYFEEIDLALRTKQAGWKVYFAAGIAVDHVGGLSTGFGDRQRRMPGYWFDSRRRYFVKHHGRVYAAACDAAWLCGHAILKAKSSLLRRSHELRPRLGRDFLRYGLANFGKAASLAKQNAILRGALVAR